MLVEGLLDTFYTIGKEERAAVDQAMAPRKPLSGYLGGIPGGGPQVEALEQEFADALGVKFAVAVNSATSGLLIACMVNSIPGEVVTTPFTMSATAAAPRFLRSDLKFGDIEPETFCLRPDLELLSPYTTAVIVVNLFGHPAALAWWRKAADAHKFTLIEDSSQAPFAMEYEQYAGTVGHMGVFSFNVHKHLQAGEGGLVVTNDAAMADKLRLYRNHSEMAWLRPGLNVRMTELTAAICRAQLRKRDKIISERVEIAESLSETVKGLPGLTAPAVRTSCKHVYYCWALKVSPDKRDQFVDAMNAEGFPLRKGYVEALYQLPSFALYKSLCPIAETAHRSLALYENCGYTPSVKQLSQMQEALKQSSELLRESPVHS